MRLGLLGGVFDPIHIGHLHLANQAASLFKLDKVYFLPTAVPPHKGRSSADAPDRWVMVKRAIGGDPQFSASRHEMDRTGPAYTIDTVRWFRSTHKGDLFYIMGLDAFADIHRWKESEELLRSCNFIALSRPGGDPETAARRLAARLKKRGMPIAVIRRAEGRAELKIQGCRYRIAVCRMPELAVSSTAIREKIKAGGSVKYLVPKRVEDYIIDKGLYR